MSSEVKQNVNKVTDKTKETIENSIIEAKKNSLQELKDSKSIKSQKKLALKKKLKKTLKKSIKKKKLSPKDKVSAEEKGKMQFEVEHNVNKVTDEKKEMIENASNEVKEGNDSQESRSEGENHANDRPEEFKVSDCENENTATEDEDSRKHIKYSQYIELQKKRGEKLITDVRRYLTINDFQAATDVLSEICNLFINLYGEMTEECADVYYMFGCALFEFGLKKKDDENENVFVQKDLTNKNDVINDDDKSTIFDEKVEVADIDKKKLVKRISVEKTLDEFIEKSTVKEKPSPEDKVSADEKGGVCDVNVFQLSRVMLDFAMVIYKKINTEDSKFKLADVLMKCWEVSIENGLFKTATYDVAESIETRRLLLQ